MSDKPNQARCDNCGLRVVVRGSVELVYVHERTGSPFCTTVVATVNGQVSPA